MKVQFAFFLVLVGLALSESHKGQGKRKSLLRQRCEFATKRCATSLKEGEDKLVLCAFDGARYVDVENTKECLKKDVLFCNKDLKLVHPRRCGQCDEEIILCKKKKARRGTKQVCDQTGKTYERRCDVYIARCQGVAENIPFADLPRHLKCPKEEPEVKQA
ncbi:uncharacterized protein [Clytia hemisphaerica]|uniref:Uncharacterized protein n=1 Tax=Clytia hemisphaerica TaxID=252671 RepID=A0A7M5WWF3_9CNID